MTKNNIPIGIGTNITPGGGAPSYNANINGHEVFNSANISQFNPAINVERGLNQMRSSYGLYIDNLNSWDLAVDQGIRSSVSMGSPAGGGGYDFGRTNNAFSLAGLGWGINENVWVNNGQWLGKNLKYNSLTWGGNQWTGARSIALKSAKFAKVLGEYAFYVNAAYSLYGVGSGLYTQDYSKAMFSGMSGIYSGIATYGGIPGLVIAGPLVFIDATIGLDTYMQNQIDVGIQRGNQISNGNYSMWAYPRFGQSVR